MPPTEIARAGRNSGRFQKGNQIAKRAVAVRKARRMLENPYERVRKRVDRLIWQLERKLCEPARANALVAALKLSLEMVDRMEFSETLERYRDEILKLKRQLHALRLERLQGGAGVMPLR